MDCRICVGGPLINVYFINSRKIIVPGLLSSAHGSLLRPIIFCGTASADTRTRAVEYGSIFLDNFMKPFCFPVDGVELHGAPTKVGGIIVLGVVVDVVDRRVTDRPNDHPDQPVERPDGRVQHEDEGAVGGDQRLGYGRSFVWSADAWRKLDDIGELQVILERRP